MSIKKVTVGVKIMMSRRFRACSSVAAWAAICVNIFAVNGSMAKSNRLLTKTGRNQRPALKVIYIQKGSSYLERMRNPLQYMSTVPYQQGGIAYYLLIKVSAPTQALPVLNLPVACTAHVIALLLYRFYLYRIKDFSLLGILQSLYALSAYIFPPDLNECCCGLTKVATHNWFSNGDLIKIQSDFQLILLWVIERLRLFIGVNNTP